LTPVIIDTDPGIDDALALLLAWSSPEVRVDALTTVAGNVPLAAANTNVRRLLALRQPTPRPFVAAGAAGPLARALSTATRYHGEDGLGDLADWPAVEAAPLPGDAVGVIVDAVRRHRRDLTLIALGPLTNVAMALAADAVTLRRVGRMVAMGGAVDVPGNVTPTAEFNMSVDPEAAERVFAAGLPIELVPLDATRQAMLSRERLGATLARSPGTLGARVQAITERAFRIEHGNRSKGMALHDPLAVALAVDPSLAEWESVRIAVGPGGETRRVSGTPNCRVAKIVHTDRFLQMFLDRLCQAPTPRGASS
jgi:inosine-uridine nucleoside N-ribohydrolase